MTEREKYSRLYDYHDADDLIAYLYSFLLIQRNISVDEYQRYGEEVNAKILAEIDIWAVRLGGGYVGYRNVNRYIPIWNKSNNTMGVIQPTGSELVVVKFVSSVWGEGLVCAEIDFRGRAENPAPRVLSIFLGDKIEDIMQSRFGISGPVALLHIEKTGRRGLLFGRGYEYDGWEVVPMMELSLGADRLELSKSESIQGMSLEEFLIINS